MGGQALRRSLLHCVNRSPPRPEPSRRDPRRSDRADPARCLLIIGPKGGEQLRLEHMVLWRMQPQDYEREVTLRSAVPTRLSGARMRRAGARWSCCPLTAPHRHGNVPAASRICHPTRIGDVSCGAGGFEVALNLLDLMDKRIVELQRRLDASGGERDSTLTLVLSTLNALRDRKRSISPPTFRELVAPPSS